MQVKGVTHEAGRMVVGYRRRAAPLCSHSETNCRKTKIN